MIAFILVFVCIIVIFVIACFIVALVCGVEAGKVLSKFRGDVVDKSDS